MADAGTFPIPKLNFPSHALRDAVTPLPSRGRIAFRVTSRYHHCPTWETGPQCNSSAVSITVWVPRAPLPQRCKSTHALLQSRYGGRENRLPLTARARTPHRMEKGKRGCWRLSWWGAWASSPNSPWSTPSHHSPLGTEGNMGLQRSLLNSRSLKLFVMPF